MPSGGPCQEALSQLRLGSTLSLAGLSSWVAGSQSGRSSCLALRDAPVFLMHLPHRPGNPGVSVGLLPFGTRELPLGRLRPAAAAMLESSSGAPNLALGEGNLRQNLLKHGRVRIYTG